MSFAKWILIPAGIAAAGILAGTALGLRLNITPSVPIGLYLEEPPQSNPETGALVVACLDIDSPATVQAIERGYLPVGNCPGAVAPVLKPIAAVAGDRVTTTESGIAVNGRLLPGTAPRGQDPQGRLLARPAQNYTVPPGTVLLLVNRPGSFDGRYFGPLPVSNIRGQARPLLLF